MQRRVLEEEVLEKSSVDVCVYLVACVDDLIDHGVVCDHDEGSCLGLGHPEASLRYVVGSHLKKKDKDMPVFVYVSNSIKPGRLFGDPFTGQLAAYSTAFGKFDPSSRMVVAYFPHQVHTQALQNGVASTNKGMTLMTELTDYIIFHAGVAVNLGKKEVL